MTAHGTLDAADQLNARQFLIAVRKLADCLSYGTDRSPFLGSGIEFAQSRQYQYGDPIKSIDWRVTARTGKVFIKEYEAPKRLPCYLMIDTSASMMISSHRRTKYATAIHIGGGLALACLDRISPVGIIGVGDRDLRTTPTLSKLDIMEWLHRLRHFRYDESTSTWASYRRVGVDACQPGARRCAERSLRSDGLARAEATCSTARRRLPAAQ